MRLVKQEFDAHDIGSSAMREAEKVLRERRQARREALHERQLPEGCAKSCSKDTKMWDEPDTYAILPLTDAICRLIEQSAQVCCCCSIFSSRLPVVSHFVQCKEG